MGYAHIENLYKNQDILLFKECYALEKIHGTSAHVGFRGGELSFFPGGIKLAAFEALFDREDLHKKMVAMGHDGVTVYGEAYGGSCQKMSHTYGTDLRFVAFDVQVGETWLRVPDAHDVSTNLGLAPGWVNTLSASIQTRPY